MEKHELRDSVTKNWLVKHELIFLLVTWTNDKKIHCRTRVDVLQNSSHCQPVTSGLQTWHRQTRKKSWYSTINSGKDRKEQKILKLELVFYYHWWQWKRADWSNITWFSIIIYQQWLWPRLSGKHELIFYCHCCKLIYAALQFVEQID